MQVTAFVGNEIGHPAPQRENAHTTSIPAVSFLPARAPEASVQLFTV
jgi:hypothetical protein